MTKMIVIESCFKCQHKGSLMIGGKLKPYCYVAKRELPSRLSKLLTEQEGEDVWWPVAGIPDFCPLPDRDAGWERLEELNRRIAGKDKIIRELQTALMAERIRLGNAGDGRPV